MSASVEATVTREVREPVFVGNPTDAALTDQLLSPMWAPPGNRRRWLIAFAITGSLALMLFVLLTYTAFMGIGLWGNNVPVAWAMGIINFVWWIGIGHAGTFISAILLLFEQKWRTSINRFAEAMTLFAVIQAGIFPLMHTGRPWFAYWLVPYPATMQVWPNFKSALPWDAAAVSTYFTVSLLFWYLGLVPDLATLRDRAPSRAMRLFYGVFALGWRGSADAYRHYRLAYGLLGGIATPLVLSVHSVVSSDFAITIVPGWHSTIFPPYFVAGAIFSGFAMVVTLMVPMRWIFRLENIITKRHLDNVARMILVTGWIVAYSYITEFFIAWYSGEDPEIYVHFVGFFFGPSGWVFWITCICNLLVPQVLWSQRMRTNAIGLFVVSILINVGMWAERFSIIVLSLQREYLPSQWRGYSPTWVDWGIFIGTIGFFSFLFIAFLRFIPFIPLTEVKELKHEIAHGEQHTAHRDGHTATPPLVPPEVTP